MIRFFAIAVLALSLVGCGTLGQTFGINPPPPKAAKIKACPRFVEHDGKFFDELGAEYRKLSPGSKLKAVVSEWINLRDQSRTCWKDETVGAGS